MDPQRPPKHARLDWRIVVDRPPPHAQSAELAIGVCLRVFRLLAGEGFTPLEVSIRHTPLTAAASYVEYFGCPVRFGAAYNGFLFPRSLLMRPLESDASVHDVVRTYLNSIVTPRADQAMEPIRLLIRRMLPTGGLTIELVAAQLAMHPRTLQRRLAAQGSSFQALVDEVRRDEAERLLRTTDMPLGQLARLLGYSEQSVLTRSCRRWFGSSPKSLRRK